MDTFQINAIKQVSLCNLDCTYVSKCTASAPEFFFNLLNKENKIFTCLKIEKYRIFSVANEADRYQKRRDFGCNKTGEANACHFLRFVFFMCWTAAR